MMFKMQGNYEASMKVIKIITLMYCITVRIYLMLLFCNGTSIHIEYIADAYSAVLNSIQNI